VKTTSYWLEESCASWPTADLTAPVDVAVVGGGVTGCSCALALAQSGLRVRLYEAREIAGGASGRNGGFALRGGAMPYDHAVASMGRDRARQLWQLSERALDRLESLAGDAFRRVGSLRVAADDAERDRLAGEFVALRSDGFDVEEHPPPAGYASALLNPYDGAIQPARWVRRLAAHAVAAGAEVVEAARLDTARLEALEATSVVLATDGLTAALAPELAEALWPVRGQMLVTAPLSERLFDRPHYARDGFDYWQQLPDGRVAVGGRRDRSFETEETAVEETTRSIQRELEALTAELVGREVEITHRWAGIWGQTADRLPLVGRLRDDLWIAGGYSGHGNVLGLACGELVASAVLGESPPELELFAPSRV
jgi:gamma-glutamylputrescine oxidase